MEMMLESYFNLHYYGYGMDVYYDSESSEEEVEDESVEEMRIYDREFPFDDEIFYINVKAPRIKIGWENLPMEVCTV